MTAGTAILEAFYQAAGQFVRLDYLAELLKTPQPRITTEIAELQHLGYSIETHPHFGYRLLGSPDRLTADDIRARIRSRIIGSEVLVFDQTASTNDVVAHMARSHAAEGLVVFAESQTKGRGRHGRVWASPRGKGLWFSVLLRPKLKPSATPRLTVMASVAVARAVRKASGLDVRIKWPNDLTVNGKKVAGILTELHAEGDEVLAAILGIGIDVNCGSEDFPHDVAMIASSLQLETGRPQDRAALAVDVLRALDDCYASAQSDFDAVVVEWARLSTTLGKQIVVAMGARRIEGHAQALDADGALLLRCDSGRVERILGADVTTERA
jgi:BirA family biotin operon repressor/biotin-[acetyl-CoA-carboxylase] ligase